MQVLTFEEANGIRAGYETDLTQHDMEIKGGITFMEWIALGGMLIALGGLIVSFLGLFKR